MLGSCCQRHILQVCSDLLIQFDLIFNCPRFLFQGYPFNINVYLQHGEQRNPKIDFIGQAYNFSAPAAKGGKEVCSNCTRLQGKDAKCSAQLVISQLLRYFKHYPGASNIDISNRDQVEQFLKEKLYVKIFAVS